MDGFRQIQFSFPLRLWPKIACILLFLFNVILQSYSKKLPILNWSIWLDQYPTLFYIRGYVKR